MEAPAGGSRGPLVVTFPEPLDRGLLMLSAQRDSRTDARSRARGAIDKGETRWTFTPTEAWRPGPHVLQALGHPSRISPAIRSAARSRSTTSTR